MAHADAVNRPSVLYKYRAFDEEKTPPTLSDNTIWLSTRDTLNDPYDCYLRLPNAITFGDLKMLRSFLGVSEPYKRIGVSTRDDLLRAIRTFFRPVERLGMVAEYFRFREVISLLEQPRDDSVWFQELAINGMILVKEYVNQTSIFSMSEDPAGFKLWEQYAAGHTGYCVGYDVTQAFGPDEPIQPVRYSMSPPRIAVGELIANPVFARENLIYVKPQSSSNECEWRLANVGRLGLISSPFPITEIIFGARMPQRTRGIIRQLLAHTNVAFREVTLSSTEYRLLLREC